MFIDALIVAGGVFACLLVAAGLIHLLGKVGLTGITGWFCRAPGLDLWIFYFTILPLFAGPLVLVRRSVETDPWLAGAIGLTAAVIGQMLTVIVWSRLHELAHPGTYKGPRLVASINRNVGPVRNHVAVWWTAWAVPIFALVRVAQWFVYPPLTWLIRLPRYRTSEWVNVSRHKFSGLVGHDLIWCLYCDWMTGVWSLGTEMLRNVESFWCPIRFREDKKCDNCAIDFPDLNNGWAKADGDMADAVAALEKHYPGANGDNQWFGHPARLTVKGEPPADS